MIFFDESTNWSGFRIYDVGFRTIAYFWSNFERYSFLGIWFWNSKQQRRAKKSSIVAESSTNLILAFGKIHLQGTESAVWPRKEQKLVF